MWLYVYGFLALHYHMYDFLPAKCLTNLITYKSGMVVAGLLALLDIIIDFIWWFWFMY